MTPLDVHWQLSRLTAGQLGACPGSCSTCCSAIGHAVRCVAALTLRLSLLNLLMFTLLLGLRQLVRPRVLATSRTPYYTEAAAIGSEFFEDADDFCEEHPDVVILATSILSTEPVLRKLPLTRLKRSTLFVDVLSVKVRTSSMPQVPRQASAAAAGVTVVSGSAVLCVPGLYLKQVAVAMHITLQPPPNTMLPCF